MPRTNAASALLRVYNGVPLALPLDRDTPIEPTVAAVATWEGDRFAALLTTAISSQRSTA